MIAHKMGLVSTDCFSVTEQINFKKLYLLFDKLFADAYLMDVAEQVFPKHPMIKANRDEMLDLAKKGIMQLFTSKEDGSLKADLSNRDDVPEIIRKLPRGLVTLNFGATLHYARKLAMEWQSQGIDITPIYASTQFMDSKHEYLLPGKKAEVTRFIFAQLPEPADDVSWEQLMEFKSDPATTSKFYRLLNWISEVSRQDLSLNEVRDLFGQLYFDYQHQFNIHKMKYKLGKTEVLINAISDLVSGKLSALSSTLALLSVKKQQLMLMEAELTLPGKQLAYILEANEQLNPVKPRNVPMFVL